jgi:hypothetical protein
MEATAAPAFAKLGAPDPHAASVAIAACVEGPILHNIAGHDDAGPRPTLDLVVNPALAYVPMNARPVIT